MRVHWSEELQEWKRCRAKKLATCPYGICGWFKISMIGKPTLFDLFLED